MIRRTFGLGALLCALVIALAMPTTSAAQGVTTAAVGGRVVDEQGAGVVGARVGVTNVATGATSAVATRTDGRYFIPGLQPGTYRVQVSSLGFAQQGEQTINLALGETANLDITLTAQAVALEGITVTGAESNAVISRGRTGASAVVSDSTLRRAPTITRDLQDFTRLVPQVAVTNSTTGAVSGGGRNNRFNQLQIDGTASNDLFGLSGSGSPSGQAGAKAITLEAIQELQVVLAPFDVRQNGFTGLSVNAITRSGTNRFQGSLAGFNRNEGLTGDFPDAPPLEEFENTEIAGSLGGPIVRDKAFFFVAGEGSTRTQPVNYIAGTDPSEGITVAQATEVNDFLRSLGYEPGGADPRDLERQSTNLFGRLDFNLGQNSRLTLRHNYIDAEREDFSRSASSFQLGNAGYAQASTTNSTLLQLNSGFGSGIFNELRIGYNRVRDQRQFEGGIFPRVTVRYGNRSVISGTENFSGQNVLDQDALEITDDVTVPFGAHTLTFGASSEFAKFSNLFVRNPFGNYEFSSFEDFQAGDPSRFEYSYLCSPGLPNCTTQGNERAEFGVNRYSLYAQDAWDVNDNLQLTFGLRGDLSQLPDSPAENPAVVAAYGRSTAEVPGTAFLFNPRVGFNWDVTGDQTTQLRGGAGLFSGRTPYVWISNAYGNNGLDYVRFTCSGSSAPAFVADPDNQPTGCAGTTNAAPNEINLIADDFKSPQVARYSLAVDRQLPFFGLIATLEGLYTQTIHDVLYQNLRVIPDPQGRTVEGRPRYATVPNVPGIGDVIEIGNTDEGYTYNVTAQVQRPFTNGFQVSLAYTYTEARDVNPVTSSQAISNWRFNLTDDNPNNPGLGRADFDIPHRVVAQTTYRLPFFERFTTDLSLVYVGQSGQPFSFRYDDDVNFDSSFGNDLFFVPASADQIRFQESSSISAAQSWQNLNDLIERVDCLREARGTVVQRNACRVPWQNRVDFRLAQNVSPFGTQNAQITLDILNVGNLLNEDWGASNFVSNQTIPILRLATGSGVDNGPDASGRRLYRSFDEREDIWITSNLDSRYQIQLGLRYTF